MLMFHCTSQTHLFLQLVANLQALVTALQTQFVQLMALHLSRQEEIERKREVLSVPTARHIHVVLWFHPKGVDLQHRQYGGFESSI